MNPFSIGEAAIGREEMAFWPLVTFAFLYAGKPETWYVPGMLVLSLTGGISFIAVTHLRSRVKEYDSETDSRVKSIYTAVWDDLPENPLSLLLVLVGVLGNLYFGYKLFRVLVSQSTQGAFQSQLAVAVLSLFPVLWIGVVVSSLIWNQ